MTFDFVLTFDAVFEIELLVVGLCRCLLFVRLFTRRFCAINYQAVRRAVKASLQFFLRRGSTHGKNQYSVTMCPVATGTDHATTKGAFGRYGMLDIERSVC